MTSKTFWQRIAPLATPINVTESGYGIIPKFYIHCTQSRDLDRTSILGNVPCEKIFTAPSRSSFYSMPEKLAGVLMKIY